ncbi:MAG: 50S ribosomal protein L11 methyltransferase, partial [Bacteroidetes bacterium]|nr:50S ribosomal protein L11 methyltransferase [Bacteroidota bacterium]
LNAYISEKAFDDSSFEEILAANHIAYTKNIIPEKNWNEEWERSFEPVTVDDFCAVRASFHQPVKTTKLEIIITPKMSFGTGHHATTYLMIKALSTMDCSEKTVLDFGTGTGVLAILSEKCGAKKIVALDNDEWSISNAKENIAENFCSNICLEKAASLEKYGVFNIILANINKNVIIQHFLDFKQHLMPGGVLILSGLLAIDYIDIELYAKQNSFIISGFIQKEDWICLILSKGSINK